MSKIEIKNIYKIFGNKPQSIMPMVKNGGTKDDILEETGHTVGLDNVSLSIEEGETFVCMGLSGSGKSTLIRHINRLIEPTAGQIFIDDTDVLAMSDEELMNFRRFKASMVFQKFALLPHRTVLANTIYGLTMQGLEVKEAEERAAHWLKRVGLEGFEDRYPAQLSGGMQQRVGLARALATDADILLMDEAFSALDPLIRSDMQEILLELQEELHKTIVFITHDLDEALRIGDDIAILRDGRLVQQGSSQDIVLNPADDYVGDFIKDINRARVLTLGTLPLKKASTKGIALSNNTSLENAMKALVDAKKDSVIVVKGDKKLGSVSMHDIVHAATRSSETAGEAVTYR